MVIGSFDAIKQCNMPSNWSVHWVGRLVKSYMSFHWLSQ